MEEEEDEKSKFPEVEELGGSISASDFLAAFGNHH
jgi:hypothetical protein